MNRENYSNFDLEFYRVGEKYTVKVCSFTGEAKYTFSPPFTREEAEQFILSIQNSIYTTSQDINSIKKFGGTLFETVFQKDILASYKSSLDVITLQEGAGLRVRLHLQDVPKLAHLPWEYLYQVNTNQFLCLNRQTPIVRYLDIPKIITPLNIKLPLRILVFISSPTNLVRLNVNNERQKIQKALADLEKKGSVNFTFCENATVSELLKNLRQSEYHIFHFIGHGGFDELKKQGLLAFENEDESVDYVNAEQLGSILENHLSLRLVVLNSCEGARTSIIDPFAGIAATLVQQGIPAVLAMQFSITDVAAINFIGEFYSSIADEMPVDNAVTEARVHLFSSIDDNIEWGTPVLFMRSPDGALFTVEDKGESVEPIITRSKKKAQKRSFAVLFILASLIFGLICFMILAVAPKSSVIALDVYAKRISFSLFPESSDEEIPLLYSGIWTNSISIESFQPIKLDIDEQTTSINNFKNPITITPKSPEGRVIFSSSHPDISLQEIIADSGSNIMLHLDDENLIFEIRNSSTILYQAMSVGEHLDIFVQDCIVTDALANDLTQKFNSSIEVKLLDISRYIKVPGNNNNLISIVKKPEFEADEVTQFVIEEIVCDVEFTKDIHQNFKMIKQSTIDSIFITRNFPLINLAFRSKGIGDLQIEAEPNRFLIYDLSRIDNSLRVSAQGRLKSIKVGQGALMSEMVPGYLAFITQHPVFSVFITFLAWFLTIISPIIFKYVTKEKGI